MNDTKRIKRESPFLYALLEKQFDVTGLFLPDFLGEKWYTMEWTRKQEETYRKWFIGYLVKNRKRAREIFTFVSSRDDAEKCWLWWNLMYGFKVKEGTNAKKK